MASVHGIDQLIRRLEAIGDPHPVLRAAQLATVQEAQKLVPRKTGFLQRNIKPGSISATHAKVEARTPYAAAIERGSGLHGPKHKKYPIYPKGARQRRAGPFVSGQKGQHVGGVLAWGGPRRLSGRLASGGKPTHFAAKVMHPGVHAQPYLLPGARKAIGHMREIIVKLWNDAA